MSRSTSKWLLRCLISALCTPGVAHRSVAVVVAVTIVGYAPTAAATCILGLWTREAVYLASDGKEIRTRGNAQSPMTVCKIVSTRQGAYTMSGVVNWGNFHALALAEQSIVNGTGIEAIAQAFARAASDPLRQALIDMRRTHPLDFKKVAPAPLAVIFARLDAGTPKLAAVQFAVAFDNELSVRYDVEVVPSANLLRPYLLVYRNDAIDNFLAANPQWFDANIVLPQNMLHRLLQLAAESSSDDVGPPYSIISVTASGNKWLELGRCADK